MTLDWLEDDEVEITRAAKLGGGLLSWLALGTEETTDDGTVGFVASTPAVDRMGDSVDQQTWRLANYRRNPVFLADHRGNDVVGRVVKVGRTAAEDGAQQLRIRVRFDESDLNPRGQLLAHQHRNGFRSAVSVGFLPGETKSRTELAPDDPLYVDPTKTSRRMAGYLFRHPELLEVSSVGVPANPEALQLSQGLATAEDVDAAIARALSETVPAKLRAQLLDLLRRDAEVRSVILAAYMATPTNGGDSLAHLWSK